MAILVSTHVSPSRINQEALTALHKRVTIALTALVVWDVLGFIVFVTGELLRPTGQDIPISATLKLFGVGAYGWHFTGMSILHTLLRRWFAQALKAPSVTEITDKSRAANEKTGMNLSDRKYHLSINMPSFGDSSQTLSAFSDGFVGG
jgi:hypothetical protein